jgi:hypothetical protein
VKRLLRLLQKGRLDGTAIVVLCKAKQKIRQSDDTAGVSPEQLDSLSFRRVNKWHTKGQGPLCGQREKEFLAITVCTCKDVSLVNKFDLVAICREANFAYYLASLT